MKSILIFIAGLITGVVLLIGGGYVAVKYASNMAEDYQFDLSPDINEKLYKSAAELASAKTEYEKWVAFGDVGLWNVDNGSIEKAGLFANEVLTLAEKYKDDWNYGNAIHKGHLTLGRVALRENNVEEAKRQLILAGKTPGSPQLSSFGPNMILAMELLEKGETDVVLEYLDLCKVFWTMSMDKLTIWESKISNGEVPSFGANILY